MQVFFTCCNLLNAEEKADLVFPLVKNLSSGKKNTNNPTQKNHASSDEAAYCGNISEYYSRVAGHKIDV